MATLYTTPIVTARKSWQKNADACGACCYDTDGVAGHGKGVACLRATGKPVDTIV